METKNLIKVKKNSPSLPYNYTTNYKQKLSKNNNESFVVNNNPTCKSWWLHKVL